MPCMHKIIIIIIHYYYYESLINNYAVFFHLTLSCTPGQNCMRHCGRNARDCVLILVTNTSCMHKRQ